MLRRIAPLAVLVLVLLPLVAGIAFSQRVAGFSLSVEKSELRLKIYPDGSVKIIYGVKAAIALPPGSLNKSKLDIRLDYENSYEKTSSSGHLVLSGVIESPSMSTSKGKLGISIEAEAAQRGTRISAKLSGTIVLQNESTSTVIKIKDVSIKADNASKALFHVEIEAKGLRPGKAAQQTTPSVSSINEMLARNGIDYVKISSIGVMLEEGGKTKIIANGVIDIDKMLSEAVAAGMPSTDAAKLKKLLETSMNLESKTKLDASIEASSEHRIVINVEYSTKTSGDVEKAEEISKQVSPLVTELLTALVRKAAQATGNQRLMQLLLISSMTNAEQAGLPVAVAPPTKSEVKAHIYSSGDKIVIEVSYEGPRQRIVPSSGSPSTDAEKMLTLVSAQLTQVKSQLARLGLVLPGAEKIIPSKVVVEPASAGVKVSKTEATLSELPSLRVKIVQTATPTPPSPAPTTTTASKTSAPSPTATASTTSAGGATRTATAKPTSSATQTTAKTTTTGKGRSGESNTLLVGGLVVAIAAIIVAIIISRKK